MKKSRSEVRQNDFTQREAFLHAWFNPNAWFPVNEPAFWAARCSDENAPPLLAPPALVNDRLTVPALYLKEAFEPDTDAGRQFREANKKAWQKIPENQQREFEKMLRSHGEIMQELFKGAYWLETTVQSANSPLTPEQTQEWVIGLQYRLIRMERFFWALVRNFVDTRMGEKFRHSYEQSAGERRIPAEKRKHWQQRAEELQTEGYSKKREIARLIGKETGDNPETIRKNI